jgi:DNA anti-recombination protein RmuC
MRHLWLVAVLLHFAPDAHASGMSSILEDPITVGVIGLNAVLLLFFLWRLDRFAVVHGPEILTTVGIFGCFLGIAIALLNFNTADVSKSVPQLLAGVKTAFWASVSGVFGALTIRFVHRFKKTPIQQTAGTPKAANLDDMVTAMQNLQRSIAGNDEGTLLSQLKLMRQDQSDQLQALRKSFDEFSKKMAEDGSKALIDALREVIKDFNTQINEQFGENFKQLNQAVGALLIWQEQYKRELDQLQIVQKDSADNLKASAENFKQLVDQSVVFVTVAKRLEELITSLNKQYDLIQQSELALSKVLIEMKDVTPQFARKLDELTESMKNGVSKVQSDVGEVIRNFGSFQQSSSSEMKTLLSDTMKKVQSETNEQLLKNLEIVRQGVITLDKGLQEELTKSLETLARQLGSLSEKFASDYGPLTDRLREVVRIAQRVG